MPLKASKSRIDFGELSGSDNSSATVEFAATDSNVSDVQLADVRFEDLALKYEELAKNESSGQKLSLRFFFEETALPSGSNTGDVVLSFTLVKKQGSAEKVDWQLPIKLTLPPSVTVSPRIFRFLTFSGNRLSRSTVEIVPRNGGEIKSVLVTSHSPEVDVTTELSGRSAKVTVEAAMSTLPRVSFVQLKVAGTDWQEVVKIPVLRPAVGS